MNEIHAQLMPIEDVLPYEGNAKVHDEAQVAKIATSIEQFGWDQPIVVDKDGVIIKGHGRRLAAIKLGLREVPVLVRSDLTPAQVKAARIADNRVALGGIDQDILKQELSELFSDTDVGFSASDLGFDDVEIESLFAGIDMSDVLTDDQDGEPNDDDDTPPGENKTPKEAEYKPAFQIVVECENEADQEQLYGALTEQGYSCKVLSM